MSEKRKEGEEISKLDALAELARRRLISFCCFTQKDYSPNWHHKEIAKLFENIFESEEKFFFIFIPPRFGKSELSSVKFPAWYLGKNPRGQIITASYSAELAQFFGQRTRDLVSSSEYRYLFPDTKLKEDSQSRGNWFTSQGGSYLSVGVGGPITGRGANIILIDDPVKNREEAESEVYRDKVWNWFTSTAYTRLEPNGKVIVVMTRWHLDDLAGRLMKLCKEQKLSYKEIHYPAIALDDEPNRKAGEPLWPKKYPLKELSHIRKTIGVYDWQSLYMQNPISSETQEFKPRFFQYPSEAKIQELNVKILNNEVSFTTTVDLAVSQKSGADKTAIVTVLRDPSSPHWYIWEIINEHLSPRQCIEYLFSSYEKYHQVAIGVETVAYQQAFVHFLREEMSRRGVYLPIREMRAVRNKELRIRGLLPRYEAGTIWHKKDVCMDLEDQLLSFPQGKHDDVPDALAYQLELQAPAQVGGHTYVDHGY